MAKQESHFVHRNGNWEISQSASVPQDESIRFLATVIIDGAKRLVLIDEIDPLNERKTAQWPHPSVYPDRYLKESLRGDKDFKFRLFDGNSVSDNQPIVEFNGSIQRFEKTFVFEASGKALPELKDDQPRTFYATFRRSDLSKDQKFHHYHVRAFFNGKSSDVLKSWNYFFRVFFVPLIIQKLEKMGELPSSTSVQTPRQREVPQPPQAEVRNQQNVKSVDNTKESQLSNPGVQVDTSEELAASNLKNQTIQTSESTYSLKKRLLSHIAKIKVTSLSWWLMILMGVVIALTSWSLRDASVDSPGDPHVVNTADIRSQYMFFALVVASPFIHNLLMRVLRRVIKKDEVKNKGASTDYQRTLLLNTTIQGIIFALLVYLIVSLSAWSNVSDETHLWIWSDRQTFGLVITMLLGVLTAIFSNSIRDLSTRNTAILQDANRKLDTARYTLNEIHELADRLWAEYQQHYKNTGKIFLFRANQFAKYQAEGWQGMNNVLRNIQNFVEIATDGQLEQADDRNEEIKDLLTKFYPSYDWQYGGVFQADAAEIVAWEKHFLNSDLPGKDIRPMSPAQLLKRKEGLLKSFESEPAQAGPVSDEPVIDGNDLYGRVLRSIALRLLSGDDGRFTVAEISERQKRLLMAIREIDSVVTNVDVRSSDATEVTSYKVFGFYPTDEQLTLWFMDGMIKSSPWQAVGNQNISDKQDQSFDAWLTSVYKNLANFHTKNKKRFDRLEDLVKKTEELFSAEGIPSSLLLDDVHLLQILMSVGTDMSVDTGGEEPLEQSIQTMERNLTLARCLTYASVYYSVLVWGRGDDRALPPTFPSPLPRKRNVETKTDHASGRFEKLRNEMFDVLSQSTEDSTEMSDDAWSITLEISNRQGPLLNWIRASRAYQRRSLFLFSPIVEDEEMEWISEVPPVREILMKKLFVNEVSSKVSRKKQNPNWDLFSQIHENHQIVPIKGPRSLKVARKSSYSSFNQTWEGSDD